MTRRSRLIWLRNKIKAERTEAGTYYEIQQPGGEPVKEGQSISVKYTGKLLDGTVFDSNVDTSLSPYRTLYFHHWRLADLSKDLTMD